MKKKSKEILKKNKMKKIKEPTSSKSVISFPAKLLEPIKKFLISEEKELKNRKKKLKQADPFSDPGRTRDNAAVDMEAVEQFGHQSSSAMQKEVERKIIQVRKALTSIKIGKYGVCEKCNKMIDTDRLMIIPEATICIKCEKKNES
jgi:RNA polymerase-binding transcription factor DksA